MAGLPWYCIASDFSGNTKVLELCDAVDDPNAGMYLVRLFEYCANRAQDGKIRAAAVEGAATWRGKRGVLVKALVDVRALEQVEDGVFLLHGWEERNGARIREWVRSNGKRKPGKNPAATTPETPEEPRENPAGFSEETTRGVSGEPRVQDVRRKTEDEEAAALRASAREAHVDDDGVPVRRLELVDASGPALEADTSPAVAFRQRLAESLARTAPHPVGGGKAVLDSVEASLQEIPLDEAVELVRARVLDDIAARRKPPQTLKLMAQILADEVVRRRALRTSAAPTRAAAAEMQAAIERAHADCPEWGKVLQHLDAKLRPDIVARWFSGIRGQVDGDTLTLLAPTTYVRDFVSDNYRPWLADELVPSLLGRPMTVQVVAAQLAAGGQA